MHINKLIVCFYEENIMTLEINETIFNIYWLINLLKIDKK